MDKYFIVSVVVGVLCLAALAWIVMRINKHSDAICSMFKNPSGTYDAPRILMFIGGMNGIIAPVVFQAWAMAKGQEWDPLAFCTAYGGMLAAVLAAGGLSIATKDKGVASAQNTTPIDSTGVNAGGGQP